MTDLEIVLDEGALEIEVPGDCSEDLLVALDSSPIEIIIGGCE